MASNLTVCFVGARVRGEDYRIFPSGEEEYKRQSREDNGSTHDEAAQTLPHRTEHVTDSHENGDPYSAGSVHLLSREKAWYHSSYDRGIEGSQRHSS